MKGREGRGPDFGVGSQNDRLATDLRRTQTAAPQLAVERIAANAVASAKVADGKCLFGCRHYRLNRWPPPAISSEQWAIKHPRAF
jgi:hypothetical protein